MIVAIDGRGVLYADDGKVIIDASHEAALQFVTDPETGATALRDLWSSNLVALRVEKFASFQRADDNAVQVISGVTY